MLIWIPVDGNDFEKSNITTLIDVKQWALVDFEDGKVKSTNFYSNREDFEEWVDFVIIKNRFESYIDFMNEGMMVLCVRQEETLEEVIEAFTFKELDEVGF